MTKTKRAFTAEIRSAPLEEELTPELLDRFAAAIYADKRLAGPVAGADRALGTLSLRTSIDAPGLAGAIAVAEAAFLSAVKKAKVETTVVDALAWEDVEGIDDPNQLLSTSDVATKLGISRQRVLQLVAAENFPAPAAVFEKLSVWRWGDIAEWARLTERKVKRTRKKAS